MKSLLFLIFTFFAVSLWAEERVELSGRVVFNDKGVERALVFVKQVDGEDIFRTETDKDGYFSMPLYRGTYFIEARKKIDNIFYVGFSGKNPLYLNSNSYVGVKLLPPSRLIKKKLKKKTSILKVKILFDGNPVKDARVYLYLKEKDIKGMPFIYSEPSDGKGIAVIKDVLPGNYSIVVRKRKDLTTPLGPLSEGDLIGFYSERTLDLKEGFEYLITVNLFKKVQEEIGKPIDVKNDITIKGVVLDEEGKPLSDLYAFLYTKKEMGHERPVSISQKTKEDGIFELIVPQKGRYYLGVRQFYGGTPIQGEWYGLYDKTFDHHIDIFENMSGITIKAKKILR